MLTDYHVTRLEFANILVIYDLYMQHHCSFIFICCLITNVLFGLVFFLLPSLRSLKILNLNDRFQAVAQILDCILHRELLLVKRDHSSTNQTSVQCSNPTLKNSLASIRNGSVACI